MLLAKPNNKTPPLLVIFYPLQICFWKTIWACPCWSQCIGCWDVSRWPYLWDNTAWSHFANLCTELIMLLQDVALVGTTLCWFFWPVTFSSVPTSKSSLHRACWRAMVKGYNILSIICNLKRQIFITCQGQVLSEVRSTTLTIVQVYRNIMCHIVYKLSLKLYVNSFYNLCTNEGSTPKILFKWKLLELEVHVLLKSISLSIIVGSLN